jgi:hypothetical protein
VRYLGQEVSHAYQQAALDIAQAQGIARVHLDSFWWSVERDPDR